MFEIKEDLTIENILNKVTELELFQKYCTNFKRIGKHFNSELRNDTKASCMVSQFNGRLWYKDFGELDKSCDVFSYIGRKYNLSFIETLNKINVDFNLNLKTITVSKSFNDREGIQYISSNSYNYESKVNNDTIIEVNYRDWLNHDIEFWSGNYKLPLDILKFYKINPINKMWINGREYSTGLYTYSFLVNIVNGFKRYKIYSPYDKYWKWISNCKSTDYQGYNQLPRTGKRVVITKSLKDVAVLCLFKLPSIAPQSESIILPKSIIDELSSRFELIYMFFDNDDSGKRGSSAYNKLYNIPERFIPIESGVKDISDYINKYSYIKTQELITKLFYE